jgi:hypothetical protein
MKALQLRGHYQPVGGTITQLGYHLPGAILSDAALA